MTRTDREILIPMFIVAFECVLVVLTFPLWSGNSEFPAVPLIGIPFSRSVRLTLGLGLLGACASFLVAIVREWRISRFKEADETATPACFTRVVRLSALGIVVASGLCVVANQHCLQAWHWLLMIVMVMVAGIGRQSLLPSLSIVLAGVYICSGLSRISFSDQPNATEMIVQPLLGFVLPQKIAVDLRWIRIAAMIATAGEILTGLFLCLPKTRKIGLVMAIGMHLSLMLALGPFGLRHHWGVVLWNLCFACTLPLVFGGAQPIWDLRRSWPGVCVTLFSLSGLAGIADNWPSWQLYSSRPETWELWLSSETADELPSSLHPFLSDHPFHGEWRVFKLDRWSLNETGAPMYPEDRFQYGVIRDVLSRVKTPRFRVLIDEPQVTWWNRQVREIDSMESLETEARKWILGFGSR